MATAINLDNQMLDLEEFLTDLPVKLTDEDYIKYAQSLGLDMQALVNKYTEDYNDPDNEFMRSMKSKKLANLPFSYKMNRAILNVWWEHLHGIKHGGAVKDTRDLECFTCKAHFVGMDALLDHKAKAHSNNHFNHAPGCVDKQHDISTPCPTQEEVKSQPVIANQDSKLLLDLSELPDGRYAVPDLTGKNDYIFLMVRRQRHTQWRDRRYVYGKIITGGEWVEAGTIEVKIWSSDSKELIGEQKPGELYKGEYEIELNAIKGSPAPWAMLFGTHIGRCGICGKTLTDDVSRSDGFGPECIKKINDGYWSHRPESFVNRNAAGEPWCEKHQDYHRPQPWCKK